MRYTTRLSGCSGLANGHCSGQFSHLLKQGPVGLLGPPTKFTTLSPNTTTSLVYIDNAKLNFRTVVLQSARDGVVLAAFWVLASRNGVTHAEECGRRAPGRDVRDCAGYVAHLFRNKAL